MIPLENLAGRRVATGKRRGNNAERTSSTGNLVHFLLQVFRMAKFFKLVSLCEYV